MTSSDYEIQQAQVPIRFVIRRRSELSDSSPVHHANYNHWDARTFSDKTLAMTANLDGKEESKDEPTPMMKEVKKQFCRLKSDNRVFFFLSKEGKKNSSLALPKGVLDKKLKTCGLLTKTAFDMPIENPTYKVMQVHIQPNGN